jgi:hypothetical protein
MRLLLVVYYGWYSVPVITRISNEIKHLEDEILRVLEKGSAEEHFYKILELLKEYSENVKGEGGFLPDNSFSIEFYLE